MVLLTNYATLGHEMTQNEANQEAAILKQKIDDKDAIEFVDTFLALLNVSHMKFLEY